LYRIESICWTAHEQDEKDAKPRLGSVRLKKDPEHGRSFALESVLLDSGKRSCGLTGLPCS